MSAHENRQDRTYQAGHRAGWIAAMDALGVSPASLPYSSTIRAVRLADWSEDTADQAKPLPGASTRAQAALIRAQETRDLAAFALARAELLLSRAKMIVGLADGDLS